MSQVRDDCSPDNASPDPQWMRDHDAWVVDIERIDRWNWEDSYEQATATAEKAVMCLKKGRNYVSWGEFYALCMWFCDTQWEAHETIENYRLVIGEAVVLPDFKRRARRATGHH